MANYLLPAARPYRARKLAAAIVTGSAAAPTRIDAGHSSRCATARGEIVKRMHGRKPSRFAPRNKPGTFNGRLATRAPRQIPGPSLFGRI
jgi:hypothetical protein